MFFYTKVEKPCKIDFIVHNVPLMIIGWRNGCLLYGTFNESTIVELQSQKLILLPTKPLTIISDNTDLGLNDLLDKWISVVEYRNNRSHNSRI
jgi:hypothetical protein